ncbi:MAG: MBL fold metallo-hydrolase [Clostridia bacterium]|nr:MBL fold metallo-hydrolase [Clostridia bacterium]
MKITYIGQAGLLFEKNGFKFFIDPYLSDYVEKFEPRNYRRQPVDESLFDVRPDLMIFTHDHIDHYDPETASRFITKESKITVLGPTSVMKLAKIPETCKNFVQFNAGTTWTEGGISFTAVPAEHSDPYAVGVIVDDGERKYYVTGDTLYSERIFPSIPGDIFALFLPVNGVGNNMNMTDASAFARRVGAKYTVPFHIGMFDELTADAFECEGKVIPEIYKEIKF